MLKDIKLFALENVLNENPANYAQDTLKMADNKGGVVIKLHRKFALG
jgi:hypothetical protein